MASHALATDYSNFPEFKATGQLLIFYGTNRSLGTGILISDQWVLTAAHNLGTNVSSLNFIVDNTTYQADIAQIYWHPLWFTPNVPAPSQGWDVALFRLVAPVTNSIVFPQLYTQSNEMGKVGFTLGAGIVGTGSIPISPQTNNPFLMYAMANTIDRTTAQTNTTTNKISYTGGLFGTDFDSGTNIGQNTFGAAYATNAAWIWDSPDIITNLNPPGTIVGNDSSSLPFTFSNKVIEGSAAPGDSGGPTFIQDGTNWKIAGLTAWGMNPWDYLTNGSDNRGLYGDVSYMTRVSEHADWIYSVIPEPATSGLLASGVLLVFFALWRRHDKQNN